MDTTRTQRKSQPVHYDVVDADDLYTTRMPSSTRRYKTYNRGENTLSTCNDPVVESGSFLQRRASRDGQGIASKAVNPSIHMYRAEQTGARRRTPLLLMLGATTAVVLVMLISALVSWWQGVMDNVHYGYPRTSQLDAVVGHNDSETNQTHFIFLNLHGHIEVIEIPGGDTAHPRIFTGPTLVGTGQDLVPVTGEIRSEDGRRDLVIHIQNQQIVYINDGSTFHQQ
jgi:hypothetical protein